MKSKHLVAILALSFSVSAFAGGIGSPEANASAAQSQGQGQAQGQIQGQAQGQLQGQAQFSNNENRNTNISGSHSSAFAGSVAGASSKSSSGGNSQAISINHEAARPAASAPGFALTSVGTDNCLGSASASLGTGFFSIGGASTTESVECNRRAYSRALRDLGQQQAALALLCLNPEVASVTASCPKPASASAPVASRSASYDPFICSRTGEQCK